ncbi:hypothetical protein [Candidatus Nitrososphaera gargensis]|uniref:hypothetical protein n=1 Tax=Candidatus Nitrososphaera gargensis TaxID=497727 RepID=UPI0011E550B3|nr:hypothetical protein [Candidatus Nitrososphaera gargensis]
MPEIVLTVAVAAYYFDDTSTNNPASLIQSSIIPNAIGMGLFGFSIYLVITGHNSITGSTTSQLHN